MYLCMNATSTFPQQCEASVRLLAAGSPVGSRQLATAALESLAVGSPVKFLPLHASFCFSIYWTWSTI